jgi:hypothetical protein
LEAGQSGKVRHFWERKHARGKRQLEGRTTHAHAGRPNDGRVRVLVMYCKWLKSQKMYKYRYLGIIRGWFRFIGLLLLL